MYAIYSNENFRYDLKYNTEDMYKNGCISFSVGCRITTPEAVHPNTQHLSHNVT